MSVIATKVSRRCSTSSATPSARRTTIAGDAVNRARREGSTAAMSRSATTGSSYVVGRTTPGSGTPHRTQAQSARPSLVSSGRKYSAAGETPRRPPPARPIKGDIGLKFCSGGSRAYLALEVNEALTECYSSLSSQESLQFFMHYKQKGIESLRCTLVKRLRRRGL